MVERDESSRGGAERRKPRRILVLTFHGLGEPPKSVESKEVPFWVSGESFAAVLEAVRDREDVLITFDDGNRSDVETALPALLERGMRAEFFALAGRLGERGRLSAQDVGELAGAGMTIGSHGMDHRKWRNLDAATLRRETVEARAILQDAAQQPVSHAAAPFGTYDARTLRALLRAGFERVYTSEGGLTRSDRWLMARHTVKREDRTCAIEHLLAGEPWSTRLTRAAKIAVKRRR